MTYSFRPKRAGEPRRQLFRARLSVEPLEPRMLLAVVANPDVYAATEDLSFTTGVGRRWNEREYDVHNALLNGTPAQWGPIDQPTSLVKGPFDCRGPASRCGSGQVDAFNGDNPTIIHAPNGWEVTVLGRAPFTLTAAQAASTSARIDYMCDSGCIFYINGARVGASPEMVGVLNPTPSSFAAGAGDETEPYLVINNILIPSGLLVEGENVLAIETHQDNLTNADIGFDAELTLSVGGIVVERNRSVAQGGWYVFDDLPITSQRYPTDTAPSQSNLGNNDDLSGAVGPLMYSFDLTWPGDTNSARVAGTIENLGGGEFGYEPTPGYPNPTLGDSGQFQFNYSVADNEGSSSATVTVNVSPTNDAPIANNDRYYTIQGSRPLEITLADAPEIIAVHSSWSFSDNNTDQHTLNPDWNRPDFDPTQSADWQFAQVGPLGFGDNGEWTTIRFGSIAYYFQRTFDLPGEIPRSLLMGLLRDDGAIVYINGVEVHRTRSLQCPAPVTHQTLANCNGEPTVGGLDELTYFEAEIMTDSIELMATGNTIAVEVHQSSPGSGDLGFDLWLTNDDAGLRANDVDEDDTTSDLRVVLDDVSAFTPDVGQLDVHDDGTFVFTPAWGVSPGDYSFTYHVVDDGLPAAPPRASNIATATITVLAGTCRLPDVDGDGNVDREDLAAFTRFYSSRPQAPHQADLNCDGVVSLKDLVLLRNALTPPASPEAPAADNEVNRPASPLTAVARRDTLVLVALPKVEQYGEPYGASPSATNILRGRRRASGRERAIDDFFTG